MARLIPVSISIMLVVQALFCAAQATPNTFTVTLNKQDVPVTVNGTVVSHKTAYFGNVFVGLPHPQNFTVVFDTGSGHLFLPSVSCVDESCVAHQQYDRSASGSAVDVNHDGAIVLPEDELRDQVSIAYGTGEIVGEFVKDTICIGAAPSGESLRSTDGSSNPSNCARARLITAREMSPEPFKNFVFDGVLGLGLGGLALDPEFHFLGQMTKNGHSLAPIFGVFLASTKSKAGVNGKLEQSEITFGGHDTSKTEGPLSWVSVEQPENGHWRIKIQGIRVGDQRVAFCEDQTCTAIFDTGTSMLGVPRESLTDILWRTARHMLVEQTESGEVPDCRDVDGPPLIFELDNGLEMRLEAEDYSRPAPSKVQGQSICRASLLPIDMPTLGAKVFIWGEPVLKKYYTAYDARAPPRVGFAPAITAGSAKTIVV